MAKVCGKGLDRMVVVVVAGGGDGMNMTRK